MHADRRDAEGIKEILLVKSDRNDALGRRIDAGRAKRVADLPGPACLGAQGGGAGKPGGAKRQEQAAVDAVLRHGLSLQGHDQRRAVQRIRDHPGFQFKDLPQHISRDDRAGCALRQHLPAAHRHDMIGKARRQ